MGEGWLPFERLLQVVCGLFVVLSVDEVLDVSSIADLRVVNDVRQRKGIRDDRLCAEKVLVEGLFQFA